MRNGYTTNKFCTENILKSNVIKEELYKTNHRIAMFLKYICYICLCTNKTHSVIRTNRNKIYSQRVIKAAHGFSSFVYVNFEGGKYKVFSIIPRSECFMSSLAKGKHNTEPIPPSGGQFSLRVTPTDTFHQELYVLTLSLIRTRLRVQSVEARAATISVAHSCCHIWGEFSISELYMGKCFSSCVWHFSAWIYSVV